MNGTRIYLDYNATSPLAESVKSWLASGDLLFGNPASQHSSGKAARKVINETRSKLHTVFGLPESSTKLFFHSGATEGVRTWAHSFSEFARLNGRELLICSSTVDHPAVTNLEQQFLGSHVKFLELKRDQFLRYRHQENFDAIKDRKDNNPDLIVLYHHLWVHNETGAVAPLDELKLLKTIPDLYVHVDGVQAPGKIEDWRELPQGDVWTFSAHKFGALKGIGFTFSKKEVPFYPLMTGGGQQQNLRSGTKNLQGVQSLGLALDDLLSVAPAQTSELRERLEAFLSRELEGLGALLPWDNQKKASNTIYFYLSDLSSDVAVALFDLHGLEISAGSASASGAAKPSVILQESGLREVAKNGLRLSMSFSVTALEVSQIEERIRLVLTKVRAK